MGGAEAFHGSSDARLGGLRLFFPDCRARFERMRFEDGKLSVTVEIREAALSALRIKGASAGQDASERFDRDLGPGPKLTSKPEDRRKGRIRKGSAKPPTLADVPSPRLVSATFALPPRAADLDLFLVGPDGWIYDYHNETRFRHGGNRRVLEPLANAASIDDAVRRAISFGEGPTVEFKVALQLSGDKKQTELIKTAIAFANTTGGQLLIGVDDSCDVVGIESEIGRPKLKDESFARAAQKYSAELRQFIIGKLTQVPPIAATPVSVDDHTVILVSIGEAAIKPCARMWTNEIFVRRGANSVTPSPEEIRALFEPAASNRETTLGDIGSLLSR